MTSAAKSNGTDTSLTELLESASPVIVDFGAPWCGPCKVFSPKLRELEAAAEGKYVVVSVNIVDFPELRSSYQINSLPCFVLMLKGEELGRLAEPDSVDDLIAWIDLSLKNT